MPPTLPKSADLIAAPSLEDVQFLDRLGAGLGAGRFRARLAGVEGEVSLLLEDPAHTDRHEFIGWAQRLARVSHATVPRLVRVEEVLSPGYVAFDYVAGRTLEQARADAAHPVTPLEALSMTLQVASGIRAAHQAGITHGGLAPRTIVLAPRGSAADAVRITGWLPCPEVADPAVVRKDILALGGMLYRLLTGVSPPSQSTEAPSAEMARLEGGGGRFDDILIGWEDARRDLGGLTPLVMALLEGERNTTAPASIDALIDLIVPAYRRLMDEEYTGLHTALDAGHEKQTEILRYQTQERELESKLRWVKQWLREHAADADAAEVALRRLEVRDQRLRNLELEMGMLLERRLPPTTRPARSLAPVALPPPASEPTGAQPILPTSAPTQAAALPTTAPPLAPSSDLPPPRRRRSDRADRSSRADRADRSRPASLLARARRAKLIPLAVGVSLLALAAVVFHMLPSGEEGGYEARPSGPPSGLAQAPSSAPTAVARPSAATPSPVAATAATPPSTPAPNATEPAPPEGMVYVPAGLLMPGLAPPQVDAALAQCKLDFGEKAAPRNCTPELFKDEAPGAPIPVKAFFIDRFEVNQARYNVCANRGRCPVLQLRWDLPEQPATGVDLKAAEAFCRSVDGRLPTVDEWLRAARANDGRLFPWGDEMVNKDGVSRANGGTIVNGKRTGTREDGHPYAAPVQVFSATGQSPFGVVNLSGNVREWTATEIAGSEVVMGGGWKNPGHELRLTRREYLRPTDFSADLGFRCVRELP